MMKNTWFKVGMVLLVLFILYKISSGLIWFLIQTAIYAVLIVALLIFLKKKGFFK